MLITAPNMIQARICQSCVDRKLESPKVAKHEYQPNYWLCDECMAYIKLNQSGQPEQIPADPIKSIETSDYILKNRDEFFNRKALAIANLDYDSVVAEMERNRVILFKTNIDQEALQVKFEALKAELRRQKGLSDEEWDKAHPSDKQPSIAVAKLKEEQELKKLKAIAKQSGLTVEQVKELGKLARAHEMENLVGGVKCSKCGELVCECSSDNVISQLKTITNELRDSVAGKSEDKPKLPLAKICPLCKESYEGDWIEHKKVKHAS